MKRFISHFKDGNKEGDLPAKSQARLKKSLPPEYAAWLGDIGLSSYDSGFLMTTNPLNYKKLLTEILPVAGDATVIMRTSFGDLFIYHEKAVQLYQSSFHKTMEVAADLDYFFDVFLTDEKFANDYLFRDMQKKARKSLGPLKSEECYGFVPALPLGGEENSSALQKLKLMEYLQILFQAKNM